MSQLSEQELSGEKWIDLRSLGVALRREWKIVTLCVVVAVALGVLDLRSEIYTYPVQMQLTTVQSNSDDTAGSRLSSLSGLAALASAALPPNQNALQFRLFVDSLRSRDIADELAKNQGLMKTLFGDEWDQATQSWREPPLPAYLQTWSSVRSFLGLAPTRPWHPPDGSNLLNYLNRNLEVDLDPRKPYLVKLILVSANTQFAIDFLSLLDRTADDHLRQKALLRARAYVDYLSNQLSKVTIAEHREAITQALSEQEKFAMVASSGAPFAAEVFEKPWASTLPAAPVPRQILALAAFIGAAVGSVVALVVNRFRRSARRRKAREPALALAE